VRGRTLAVATAILTAGCTPQALIATLDPPAADQFARAFIDSLRLAPAKSVQQLMVPRLAYIDAVADTIATVQRFIPVGQPDSLQLVNVSVFTGSSTQRTLEYQLHAGGKWAYIRVIVDEDAHDTRRVASFGVYQLSSSLQSLNALTLRNASFGALAAAATSLIAMLISLYAAVQVVRSPLQRKWLWVIVALLGFGKIGVAWHTGQVQQQWMAVQLLDTGIQRQGLYGPWWIFFSLPGGAFIALDRRRRAVARRLNELTAG
jgi:hypothetical protein